MTLRFSKISACWTNLDINHNCNISLQLTLSTEIINLSKINSHYERLFIRNLLQCDLACWTTPQKQLSSNLVTTSFYIASMILPPKFCERISICSIPLIYIPQRIRHLNTRLRPIDFPYTKDTLSLQSSKLKYNFTNIHSRFI